MSNNKQQGVALITALLVVALTTSLAATMLQRQYLSIQRSSNTLYLEQAYQYLLGAEAWAQRILIRDANNSQHDAVNELWGVQLPSTFIDGGTMGGRLEDAQSGFNLNNLLDHEGKLNEIEYARLQRLLVQLELPENLAQVIIDWIDADANPQPPDGAEDDSYLRRKPAYRSANQAFVSLTELRLLIGMTEDYYQRLKPHVSVLSLPTPVNLNTTTPAVLMSLVEGLSEIEAEDFLDAAKTTGFKQLNDALAHPSLKEYSVDTGAVSVSSQYFRFHADVQIENLHLAVNSLIYRQGSRTWVLQRERVLY